MIDPKHIQIKNPPTSSNDKNPDSRGSAGDPSLDIIKKALERANLQTK